MNKSNEKLSLFIGDEPVGLMSKKEDLLGFNDHASVLADALLQSKGRLSIGIFGNWGTGKTSLMNLMKKTIDERPQGSNITVWFNAWTYESESHLIVPLLATIIAEIQDNKNLVQKSFESLLQILGDVAYGFSLKTEFKIPVVGKIESEFIGKDMVDHEEQRKKKHQFLLEKSLYFDAFKKLKEISAHLKDRKIIVFIDDLDRCLPEKALKLIESIKLVLHQPGFVFVFGLDKKSVASFISKTYRDVGITGDIYLDKLFQVSFFIPDYSSLIGEYAWQLVKQNLGEAQAEQFSPLFPAIGTFCRNNPRAVKRFLNNMLIDRAITSKRKDIAHMPFIYFGLVRALQMHWPIVADAIRYNDYEICIKLSQDIYQGEKTILESIEALAMDAKNKSNELYAVYQTILMDRSLQKLLTSDAAKSFLNVSNKEIFWSLQQEICVNSSESIVPNTDHRFLKSLRGKIMEKGEIYSTVIRSGWCKDKISKLFPDLQKDIFERADEQYWSSENWQHSTKELGRVLGRVSHADGSNMLLLEFEVKNKAGGSTGSVNNVYLFANETGVEVLDRF